MSNAPQIEPINFSLLEKQEVGVVSDIINRAFHVDKFFKYQEYYDRTSPSSLLEAYNAQGRDDIAYVIGRARVATAQSDTPEYSPRCAVLITWNIEVILTFKDGTHISKTDPLNAFLSSRRSIDEVVSHGTHEGSGCEASPQQQPIDSVVVRLVGLISQVSVDPDYEKRGIGKQLIKAAEAHIISFAQLYREKILDHTANALESSALNIPESLRGGDDGITFHVVGQMEVLSVRPGMFFVITILLYSLLLSSSPLHITKAYPQIILIHSVLLLPYSL